MPIIREQDEKKYFDERELKLIKQGSGLFPAGYYPRKDRSGEGLMDIISTVAKVFRGINENKDTIKGVAEAVGSVVTAGKKIKDTLTPVKAAPAKADGSAPLVAPPSSLLAPSADSIDPDVYKNLRASVKEGTGILTKSRSGSGFKYD